MRHVTTNEAPKALGPYSQAVVQGNFCFVSMQLGINPDTGKLVSDNVREQTKRVIKNVEAILYEAGFSLADVVKTTLYIVNLGDFQLINEIYADYFTQKPSRSLVVQSSMPAGAKVALDAIAYKIDDTSEELEYASR